MRAGLSVESMEGREFQASLLRKRVQSAFSKLSVVSVVLIGESLSVIVIGQWSLSRGVEETFQENSFKIVGEEIVKSIAVWLE